MEIKNINDVSRHLEKLLQEIKDGNARQMYFLYGEEEYLKRQYRDKFLQALTDPEDTMNIHRFEGNKIDVQEVISLADTLPFFADQRTILIMDSGWFKSPCEEMAEYLKHPAETVRFLFVEKELDKRGKIYKTVSKDGIEIEFKEMEKASVHRWMSGMAAKEGKTINADAMELLTQRVGLDMGTIHNEMEKLFGYTHGRKQIVAADVEALVARSLEDRVFEMVEAIVGKQQKKALGLYYDLLALQKRPNDVLFLLTRQFNNMLQAKELKEKGFDKNGIAKKMRLPANQTFLADKYPRQAAKYRMEELKKIVVECVETEEAIKSGRIADKLGVELLIVKYSM
ncbi:MAG: DNA polymerase III subunit delta [Lachnospiraceae bacterium]|nr:DNA polymerase III subunit delta [Lachnospiraceae bacterium]